MRDNSDHLYPTYNTHIPDAPLPEDPTRFNRFGRFKQVFESRYVDRQAVAASCPQYVDLYYPNDHGGGARDINPNGPDWSFRRFVQDNDSALGLTVELISHSPCWKDTVIFVVEDDTQNGADHVDGHRSIFLAIGPWVKKQYVSKTHTSLASVFKTVNLILGLPPLNQYDAAATDLRDMFTGTPDFTPYNSQQIQYAQRSEPDLAGADQGRRLQPAGSRRNQARCGNHEVRGSATPEDNAAAGVRRRSTSLVERPALAALGVSKRYGDREALCRVDLIAQPGRMHGLLGPNGAGKTTLMRILLGLVRRDAGTVHLLGCDPDSTAGPVPDGVAGFVETPAFYPYLSGRRNLAAARSSRRPWRIRPAQRRRPVLEQVGLAAHCRHHRGRLLGRNAPASRPGRRTAAGPAAALPRRADQLSRPGRHA